jgi:hypothetical protein
MRTRLTCVVATFDLAPLQGAPSWNDVPGLKPRAEPSRPFRGEETSQILLILMLFNLGAEISSGQFAYPQLRPGEDEPPGATTGKNSS